MANEQLKPIVSLLLFLNFCMYAIVAVIGGWAINLAINRGFIIGPELVLPANFPPIFFPIGNMATGFFVIFAVIAGAIGTAAAIAGFNHIRFWNYDSLQPAAASALIAWILTLVAMGLACKEINLGGRNAKLRTMESFMIILSATQFVYILAIHGGHQRRVRN
ncbi:membrane protein PM19L-like [Typha latifolia]|uniref:membrane protein PM19L-like n=1 Tax=Typha latifolia TaxID=4733 RepID=UPI003C2FA765